MNPYFQAENSHETIATAARNKAEVGNDKAKESRWTFKTVAVKTWVKGAMNDKREEWGVNTIVFVNFVTYFLLFKSARVMNTFPALKWLN